MFQYDGLQSSSKNNLKESELLKNGIKQQLWVLRYKEREKEREREREGERDRESLSTKIGGSLYCVKWQTMFFF